MTVCDRCGAAHAGPAPEFCASDGIPLRDLRAVMPPHERCCPDCGSPGWAGERCRGAGHGADWLPPRDHPSRAPAALFTVWLVACGALIVGNLLAALMGAIA